MLVSVSFFPHSSEYPKVLADQARHGPAVLRSDLIGNPLPEVTKPEYIFTDLDDFEY